MINLSKKIRRFALTAAVIAAGLVVIACGDKPTVTTVEGGVTTLPGITSTVSGRDTTTTAMTTTDVTTAPIITTSATVTTVVPEIGWDIPHEVIYLDEATLRDKIAGSWVAQMVGVSWAAPTEFKYNGTIMPESAIPKWVGTTVNDAFGQDDLYVEIPFLDAMKKHGTDATLEEIAPYFENTEFMLWHANYLARVNLQNGIDPSLAGSYLYNYHADDIDWQIEADFLGNIFPGLISVANDRAFDIGHMICYGDGAYGGVFISAMHAAAMVYDDLDSVIRIGIESIPEGTEFRALLDDVVNVYEGGKSWTECWKEIETKWGTDDKCPELQNALNIDAKINAGYILIGLLWGEGDFEETIKISMRCGQDSDCNPSSAAAVLGTLYGLEGIPEKYRSAVNYDGIKFSYTDYTLNDCIDLSLALAKESLIESGAVESENGFFVIKETKASPVKFEQWPDDELVVYLEIEQLGNGELGLSAVAVPPKGSSSANIKYKLDMGDGAVFDMLVSSYKYSESGKYTVKCVAEVDGKTFTREISVDVELPAPAGFKKSASASVANPEGGGSKNISVIIDGHIPTAQNAYDQKQYDTFTFAAKGDVKEWFAINFDHKVSVTEVLFCEGNHFNNGGWFNGAPEIELYIDGQWVKAESTISPAYPTENTQMGQGGIYQRFVFTLKEPTLCEGVRVIGTPGGSSKFITCSELDVKFDYVVDPTYEEESEKNPVENATIIVSVDKPAGAGCKDIEIIRDGYIPSIGDNNSIVQYDTYVAGNPDHEEYFGYIFAKEYVITEVVFTSGGVFHDGGWFKNGTLRLQLYINGEWVDADCLISPEYPSSDNSADFKAFTSYTFTLDNLACKGIRIIGKAGGGARFTSISELSAKGKAK